MPKSKRVSKTYDCGCIYDFTLVPKPHRPGEYSIEDIELSWICPEHDVTIDKDEEDDNA